MIGRHDRKVYVSLGLYFFVIVCTVIFMQQFDAESMATGYETRYAEALFLRKSKEDPGNSIWLQALGELMLKEAMEKKALDAYSKALEISPMNAELNNNLAWLLLTAKDESLRDPERALTLARAAATLKEEGFILDTLATAFWANGLLEEALALELKAKQLDPDNAGYYRSQLERFRHQRWGTSVQLDVP